MNKIQVTLTVEEGKAIIAQGIQKHPKFIKSFNQGNILFKGGTTVSRITEEILGIQLRISGRITSRGTVSSLNNSDEAHSIVYGKNKWINVDERISEITGKFDEKDLILCGANAIDAYGNAAIMAGSEGGGNVGKSVSSWYSEGASIIIPVGIEKLVPGNLNYTLRKSSRKGKSLSYGMSVGLIPLVGEVFTEVEAIRLLGADECYVIGSGGLGVAQGSSTFELWIYEEEDYNRVIDMIKDIKGKNQNISGIKESLLECQAICENCGRHIGCGYKYRKL